MKIELKNIKHNATMSEETHNYEASLYVDGKKIGVVGNAGHGGPDTFWGDQDAYKEANDWCVENLPKIKSYGMELTQDLEMVCGELVNIHLVTKDLKSALKSKVLVAPENEPGIFQYGWKGVRKIEQKHIEAVQNQVPDAKVLNALPFDEALKIYRNGNQPEPEIEETQSPKPQA